MAGTFFFKEKWRTRRGKLLLVAGAVMAAVLLAGTAHLVNRLWDDEPVTYDDDHDEDHFKHGSTGGERGHGRQFGFGIPYWIWIALPELFSEHVPGAQAGKGYAPFGMIYETGTDPRFDLPVGMSMRRRQGIDRVYFTCSVCHTGSVRESADAERQVVLGMPANTFNFGALGVFLSTSAGDYRFRSNFLLAKIRELEELRRKEYKAGNRHQPKAFSRLDYLIFEYLGVSLMRDQLINLLGRLSFIDFATWGPGRVDTFNAPKALLGFKMKNAPERELLGNVDFPSVWNQKYRKGMWLHWDGNNCSVDERNLSAGFGTGATPATIDAKSVLRIADWLWDKLPPAFPERHIDKGLAQRGEEVYRRHCWVCHGNGKGPFMSPEDETRVGQVTSIEQVATDRWRLDSYTPELASAQNSIYAGFPLAGDEACAEYFEKVCDPKQPEKEFRELRQECYPARFSHFRKTNGYANMPLDGLWLRAPYLHNGSVPNLKALLDPAASRPKVFYIGYDVYDYTNVGFVTQPCCSAETTKDCVQPGTGSCVPPGEGWRFDTAAKGNGNQGHEYGTKLNPEQKGALLEHLKTF